MHERIAAVLNWTPAEARQFSLPALRELVRAVDPGLADEISDVVRRGEHFFVAPTHCYRCSAPVPPYATGCPSCARSFLD